MAISILHKEDTQKVAMSTMNRRVESGRFIKEIADEVEFMHYRGAGVDSESDIVRRIHLLLKKLSAIGRSTWTFFTCENIWFFV